MGRGLPFRLTAEEESENFQNEEIWMVDTKGNGLRRLTKNGNEYFSGPHDFHPSWSPQGDALVFERHSPGQFHLGDFHHEIRWERWQGSARTGQFCAQNYLAAAT